MLPEPEAPPVAAASGPAEGTPGLCGARTRAGTPCKRRPAKGRTRCKLHGGASTGPRTPEGKAASVAATTKHGAYATSATYEEALRAAHPTLFDSGGGSPSLIRELSFARARLARLAMLGDEVPDEAVARALDSVRRLAEARATLVRDGQGQERGATRGEPWKLTLTVVRRAETRPREVGRDDPMDGDVAMLSE